MKGRNLVLALASLGLLAAGAAPAQAQETAGKQTRLIVGAPAGGGYDHLARLAARHLPRLLPGAPNIVVQNMPSGNSVAAANFIANQAPTDGTAVALLQRGMLLAKILGVSSIQFDVEKLHWLASLNSETGLVLAWKDAPHQSAKDLFERELIVGGQTGVDPEISPRIYNALIGTKFKIVNGYQGTTAIGLAMERGEVQGIGDWSWSSLKVQRPQWIAEKSVRILMQGALTRDKELPDTPNALDFVKSDVDRKAMEVYFTQKTVARPVVAPPGTQAEALAQWRKAFASLASDREFLDEADKAKIEVSVLPGPEVDKVVEIVVKAPAAVRERLVEAMKQ